MKKYVIIWLALVLLTWCAIDIKILTMIYPGWDFNSRQWVIQYSWWSGYLLTAGYVLMLSIRGEYGHNK